MIDLDLLQHAVRDSRDGITIADARVDDMPLMFVNPAFVRMTGYSEDEVIGRNCRFLRDEAMSADDLSALRSALAEGEGFNGLLPNRRKTGELFWNELSLSPIHDENGDVTHFIGFQKDVTQRVVLDQQLRDRNRDLESAKEALEELVTLDALTGVYNRRHFDQRLATLWKLESRRAESIALFFVDIDHFKLYNDHFGHQAGDRALVSVARTLERSFQRGSDFIARYGGEEFVVVACGMEREPAERFANALCESVRALEVPNPDAPNPWLSISVGFAVVTPSHKDSPSRLVAKADDALYVAKRFGRDQAVSAFSSAAARQALTGD